MRDTPDFLLRRGRNGKFRHILAFCLSMIFFREPAPTFRDHALTGCGGGKTSKYRKDQRLSFEIVFIGVAARAIDLIEGLGQMDKPPTLPRSVGEPQRKPVVHGVKKRRELCRLRCP